MSKDLGENLKLLKQLSEKMLLLSNRMSVVPIKTASSLLTKRSNIPMRFKWKEENCVRKRNCFRPSLTNLSSNPATKETIEKSSMREQRGSEDRL